MKTQKEIKLKTGETLPKGLPVTFCADKNTICLVHGQREEPYRIHISAAFKTPSMRQLERWTFDSVCESVAGEVVEPDGHDEHGSPSWLLALGMI